jgi:hypothetical protein
LVGAFDFPYSLIFLPPIFLLCFFFLPWIVMGTLSENHFQSDLFDILYDIRLLSTIRKIKSTHQFCSITPLFNLLALHNKLNKVFFSSIFCITFIYLHLYLKSCDLVFVLCCFSLNPMSILHELLDTSTVQLLTK